MSVEKMVFYLDLMVLHGASLPFQVKGS